ncbi:MAG: hypothetical protein KBT19_01410 [Lachnospiraceae bacterium]|nr:hypothetical protein [Candidatus Colinaster equi]
MMPVEAVAMDNPTNGYIEEFPVPGNPDTVITENNGTINFAKSPGTISYNFLRRASMKTKDKLYVVN